MDSGGEDTRTYIFEFFRSHNAYDMLPESGKVLLLDASVSAYSAFCIMSANEQDAVPVWDSHSDTYMGMLTVTDMLELVLICQNSKVFSSCVEGLKEMSVHNWITSYPRPPGCPDVSVEVHPDDDLMVVLRTLVRNDCRGQQNPHTFVANAVMVLACTCACPFVCMHAIICMYMHAYALRVCECVSVCLCVCFCFFFVFFGVLVCLHQVDHPLLIPLTFSRSISSCLQSSRSWSATRRGRCFRTA